MTKKKQIMERVAKKIAKHCGPISKDKAALQFHASSIQLHYDNHCQILGLYSEKETLKELKYHLTKSAQLLSQLSKPSRRVLERNIQLLDEEALFGTGISSDNKCNVKGAVRPSKNTVKVIDILPDGSEVVRSTKTEIIDIDPSDNTNGNSKRPGRLFERRLDAVLSLKNGVKKFENHFIAQGKRPGNSKPKAIAVAAACMNIWKQAYDLDKLAKTINASRLPPLGKFIDDIYAEFLLSDRNPKSAYDAIMRRGGLEAILLSLEYPKNRNI